MADKKRKKGLTEAAKRAKKRYYEKNREKIIKKQVEINKRNRPAWEEKNKERLKAQRQQKARILKERQLRLIAEWEEFGWIIAKMNIKAKLSKKKIFELLAGLVSQKQVDIWCKTGKKFHRLNGDESLKPCLPRSLRSLL